MRLPDRKGMVRNANRKTPRARRTARAGSMRGRGRLSASQRRVLLAGMRVLGRFLLAAGGRGHRQAEPLAGEQARRAQVVPRDDLVLAHVPAAGDRPQRNAPAHPPPHPLPPPPLPPPPHPPPPPPPAHLLTPRP